MKIQDIIFLIFFAFLILRHRENSFVSFGLLFLLLSIPFFYFWVFFTAERLIYYAAALILAETALKLIKLKLK